MQKIFKLGIGSILIISPLVSLISCSSKSDDGASSSAKKDRKDNLPSPDSPSNQPESTEAHVSSFQKVQSPEIAINKGRELADQRHASRVAKALEEAQSVVSNSESLIDVTTIGDLSLISRDDFLRLKDDADGKIKNLANYFLLNFGDFSYIDLFIKVDTFKPLGDGVTCQVSITSKLIPATKIFNTSLFIAGFATAGQSRVDEFKKSFGTKSDEISKILKKSDYSQINVEDLLLDDIFDENNLPSLTSRQVTPEDFNRLTINEEYGIYGYVSSLSPLSHEETALYLEEHYPSLSNEEKIAKSREGTSLKITFTIKSSNVWSTDTTTISKYITSFIPQAVYEAIHGVRILSSLSRMKIEELPRDGVVWAGGFIWFALNQSVSFFEAIARELGWNFSPDSRVSLPGTIIPANYEHTIEQENQALDGVHFDLSKWDPKNPTTNPVPNNVIFDAVGSSKTMGDKWFSRIHPELKNNNGLNLDITSFGKYGGNEPDGTSYSKYENIFIKNFQEWIEPNGVVALKIWTGNGLSRTFRTPEHYERSFESINSYVKKDSTYREKLIVSLSDSIKFIKKGVHPSDTFLQLARGAGLISPEFESACRFLADITPGAELNKKLDEIITKLDGTHYYPAINVFLRGIDDLPRDMVFYSVTAPINGMLTMSSLFEMTKWGHIAPNKAMSLNEYDARIRQGVSTTSDDYLVDDIYLGLK